MKSSIVLNALGQWSMRSSQVTMVLREEHGAVSAVTTMDANQYCKWCGMIVHPVRMDVERHIVTVNGSTQSLPLKEFELLEYLMRNSGRVLTRSQLIDRVWGSDYFGDTKTLDVHIKRLRAKVESDPANPVFIQTVRGLGYKFEG